MLQALKIILVLYRLLLTISALAVPCWYMERLTSQTECDPVPIRSAICLFIGCTVLEFALLSFMNNSPTHVRFYYVPALFSSDVSTFMYSIYIYTKTRLGVAEFSVVQSLCISMFLLRIIYIKMIYNKALRIRRSYYANIELPGPDPIPARKYAWSESEPEPEPGTETMSMSMSMSTMSTTSDA